jgi:hypothetical protein
MPLGRLLIRFPNTQNFVLTERRAEQLQANRQLLTIEATRH